MTGILNSVIAIGGTAAHDAAKTETNVRVDYIVGPDPLASVVA
jgi:hypothetical protein